MSSNPLSVEILTINSSLLSKIKAKAAIDCGSTYTNVIYATNNTIENVLLLNCAQFDSKNFTFALQWLKQHIDLKNNEIINLTGNKSKFMKSNVENFFKTRVEIIETTVSQIQGIQFLLQNTKNLQDLFFPYIEPDKQDVVRNPNLEAMFTKLDKDLHRNEDKNFATKPFPAICGFLDSKFTFQVIANDAKVQFGLYNWFGHSMFKEFAGLMLGTQDYHAIMELASKGNRIEVDTTVGDILADDVNSPYGNYPPNLPIVAFGKLSERNKSVVEGLNKNDIAAALVAFAISFFQGNIIQLAKRCGIGRVYLAGEFVQSEVMRHALANASFLFGEINLDIKILKTRHAAAIGSLITNNEDVEYFFKVNE